MKRQNLNINRVATAPLTANHDKIELFSFELDYSFGKLFSVTYTAPNGQRAVFCRQMTQTEKRTSGQHFNTLQPDKKARLPCHAWEKVTNTLLGHIHFDIPEVAQSKSNIEIKKGGKKNWRKK